MNKLSIALLTVIACFELLPSAQAQSSSEFAARRRTPQYAACVRFLNEYKVVENVPPAGVCPYMVDIYNNVQTRSSFENCVQFMADHRVDELSSPSTVCRSIDGRGVFSDTRRRDSFADCVEYMAQHRDGEQYPPSTVCLNPTQITIFYRGNAIGRRGFDRCLTGLNRADLPRNMSPSIYCRMNYEQFVPYLPTAEERAASMRSDMRTEGAAAPAAD